VARVSRGILEELKKDKTRKRALPMAKEKSTSKNVIHQKEIRRNQKEEVKKFPCRKSLFESMVHMGGRASWVKATNISKKKRTGVEKYYPIIGLARWESWPKGQTDKPPEDGPVKKP